MKGEIRKKGSCKFLDKEFYVWEREVIEKRSHCNSVNNNAGLKLDTTKEKRKLNMIIAKHFLSDKHRVLDAYGGYGITTYLWLKQGCKVDVCEEDEWNYSLLWDNLNEFHGKRKLRCFNYSNLIMFNKFKDVKRKYDLIDLDPYGSCFEQIGPALELIDNGILLVTCGEPTVLYRGFHKKNYTKRYGSDIEEFLSYRTFWKFPKDFFFEKYIKSKTSKKLKLLHYFESKVIGRLIIQVGDPDIPTELLDEFKGREKIFGDIKVFNGQKSLVDCWGVE